ncbi:MAG: PqqD family protein [Oscillospiraceae bacterium]|nr:PqqD family protein [Oscillospiraceae bacterium]MBR7010283.1 PqqD family protein [Oscillospiraceae bacterium]
MKIKSGFMMRSIAGCKVVVSVGKRTLDFNGIINLNDTGAFLWERLEQGADEDQLTAAILENYTEVDEATARQSVKDFVGTLREAGCLDD